MLHRKGQGKEAKLAYLGHVLLDNRQGLVANVCATHATGTAEREAAALLLEASAPPGSTVGADKGYDVASFVADVRRGAITVPSHHRGYRATEPSPSCGVAGCVRQPGPSFSICRGDEAQRDPR